MNHKRKLVTLIVVALLLSITSIETGFAKKKKKEDEAKKVADAEGSTAASGTNNEQKSTDEDRESDVHVVGAELGDRRAHALDIRLDEPRMVEEHAHAGDLRRVGPDGLLRVEQILPVLTAARVRAERRREDGERAPYPVVAPGRP